MHTFKVGDFAYLQDDCPFKSAFPDIYEVVAVSGYDDPDTPDGVIDQTVSLDIDLGPDVAPRDFANKFLERLEMAVDGSRNA